MNCFAKRFTGALLVLLLGLSGMAWGQTNPTAQSLPFSENFGTSSFSSLPAGFAAWNGTGLKKSLSAAESSVPTGDATVTAKTVTSTTAGVFGLSISDDGRVYIQTSSNVTNGTNQLALAISTLNKQNITISFKTKVELPPDASRAYGVVAQYRIGTSGSWTTFTNGSIEYTNQVAGTTTSFTELSFGSDADNQSVVQIRWATWRADGSGSSGGLSIDDIEISGDDIGGNIPPIITNINQNPVLDITSSTTVSVSADVTDDVSVDLVELRWGTAPETYDYTINMSVGSGDTYTTNTDIPAQTDGTTVYYVIYAEDNEEASRTSAEQSYTVSDPKTTTLPYAETFDSDLGDCYVYNASGETKYWVQTGGYAYMSGYNTGDLEEDWLILPGINLNNYSDEIMTFETWWQYGTDDEDNYLKLLYSTNYTGIGDPSLATWTELTYTQPASATIWASSGNIDLSGISGTSVWIAFKYNYSAGMYRNWRVDNISIEEVAGPLLTVSTETLSGFTYREGEGPSAEQSFTVSGINLEEDISITAPTNYEISTGTGAAFVATSPITLTPDGATVSETTIYVRLKAGLEYGVYSSETITASSANADSKTVTCSGQVIPVLPFAENFDYTENDLLVNLGWNAHSGAGTNSVRVVSPGLEFPGYPSSGIGNAAAVDNTGEDVHLVFDQVTEGSVYVSFIMKTGATNFEGYFLHLGQTNIGTTYFSRVWVNATGDGVGIGTTAPAEYIPISVATPTLIVLKFTFSNKLSELFVFNSMPSSEPATPDASFTETVAFSNIGSVALRQYDASQDIIVDGIRIATSWNDAPLPITLAAFTADYVGGTVKLAWETFSETENAAFRIYRDGEMIAELAGAGTTSEPQSYAYTDNYVIPGHTYTYVLADVSEGNVEVKHTDKAVTVTAAEGDVVKDFAVGNAYPNPFNPVTVVPLNLAKNAHVHARLYDMLGRPVQELHNGALAAGSHALRIDGANLSTGIYFVRVRVNDDLHVQKIALMK